VIVCVVFVYVVVCHYGDDVVVIVVIDDDVRLPVMCCRHCCCCSHHVWYNAFDITVCVFIAADVIFICMGCDVPSLVDVDYCMCVVDVDDHVTTPTIRTITTTTTTPVY